MSVALEIGKGTLYNAIAKYTGIVINLIVTGILARILGADIFGVVALTTVIITFFDLLGNMGFGPAIIQNKEINNSDLASIFNLTIILAIIFTAVCVLSAPLIANLYENKVLENIICILALQILFTIINVVPYSLMLKAKKFKFIAFTNLICQFIFGFLAIICAYSGWGVYSLLLAPIGTIFLALIIYSIKTRKIYGSYHQTILRYNSIRKVLSFSVYQFLFNVVNYFSRNLDKLLIGNRFSLLELGYYEKSYRLMQLPISSISSILAPTIQPILSKYQNETDKLSCYASKIILYLAYIGFTITPLLFFCSREIILIAFGSNWEPAIPIFRILALSVFAQIVDSSIGSLLQAANAPKLLFSSGLACALLNVACICIGVFILKSLNTLAWMLNLAFVMNLFVDLFFLYYLTLKESLKYVLHLFCRPIIIGSVISLSLFFVKQIQIESLLLSFTICTLISILESVLFANYMGLFKLKAIYQLIYTKISK